jgi:hypothetical protein
MTDFILRGRSQQLANPGDKSVRVGDDGSIVATERYAELAARGKVFHFSNAAFTMPVNANNLVSLFSVYNPPGSGVLMELIEAEAHAVVATTVVNAMGLYALEGQTGATFTTQGTIRSSRLTEGVASAVRAYSSLTFSGTPLLADIIGGWGAVTDGGATPIRKEWGGKIQVPPGVAIALAMTTAAATASGITALLRWAEVPYVSQ